LEALLWFINPHPLNLTTWRRKIEAALCIDIHAITPTRRCGWCGQEQTCLTVTSCHDIREDAPLSVQVVEQPLQSIR